MAALTSHRLFYFLTCCAVAAYFNYKYGIEMGAWAFGAMLYVVFLCSLFPALWQVRVRGFHALHWLDWTRLAYIPVFAGFATQFASWLPLFIITAAGLSTSLLVLLVGIWTDRASTTH